MPPWVDTFHDYDFAEIDERRITRSTPKEDGEEKQVQNVPT
jgi:hypothetical protein